MIDWNKIKKCNAKINRLKEKLKIEPDYKKKELMRISIQMEYLKIKTERLQ
jgi:hypothetical protein